MHLNVSKTHKNNTLHEDKENSYPVISTSQMVVATVTLSCH